MKNKELKKTWFIKRFNEALEEWKMSNHPGTQKALLDKILDIKGITEESDRKARMNYVTDWKNGKWLPDRKWLKCITQAMSLNEDYFENIPDSGNSGMSRATTDLEIEILESFAEEKLHINKAFLQSFSSLFDNFEEIFPFFRYMGYLSKDGEKSLLVPPHKDNFKELYRSDSGFPVSAQASAQASEEYEHLQVNLNGQIRTLNLIDILFIKEVWEKTENYIRFLFWKRHHEMEAELEKANSFVLSEKTIPSSARVNQYDHIFKEYLKIIDEFHDYKDKYEKKTILAILENQPSE